MFSFDLQIKCVVSLVTTVTLTECVFIYFLLLIPLQNLPTVFHRLCAIATRVKVKLKLKFFSFGYSRICRVFRKIKFKMSTQLAFERLKGRENFTEWKTGAKAFLISKGVWASMSTDLKTGATATEITADQKALAELILLIDPSLYSYIEDIDEAKKAWDALMTIFQDTGALRRVWLLETWMSLKFSECSSMHDYVNKKVQLHSKVRTAGFKIDDDVAGSVLLCGLGEEYKPLIMSIAADKLTMDYVKNLLLQSIDYNEGESAMYVKGNKKHNKKSKSKKTVKCYGCGGPHFRNKCPDRNNERSEKSEVVLYSELANGKNVTEENALAYTVGNHDQWFVDSGATRHMTHMNLKLENVRKPTVGAVKVADNSMIKIDHVGELKCKIGEQSKNITLGDVHYIPNLCVNLLSVSQIVKKGSTVVFDKIMGLKYSVKTIK